MCEGHIPFVIYMSMECSANEHNIDMLCGKLNKNKSVCVGFLITCLVLAFVYLVHVLIVSTKIVETTQA